MDHSSSSPDSASEGMALPSAVVTLTSFMDARRVKRGNPFTYTSRQPQGSYYVAEEDANTFWTLYCNSVKRGDVNTFTEKPDAYGPLRIDFDFRSKLEAGTKRQYSNETVSKIVSYYQTFIKEAVPEDEFDDKMLWCLVLEKPKPRSEDGVIKDGFHLHFPHFFCESWFQDEYLRSKVTTKMVQEDIWKEANYSVSVEDMIDRDIARKVWMLYGSAKTPNHKPYLFTRAINHEGTDIPLSEVFEEEMVSRKSSVTYYLPRFLSVRGCTFAVPILPKIASRRAARSRPQATNNVPIRKRKIEDIMKDIKLLEQAGIMDMLSNDRAENRNLWMDVGWRLYNVGEGCEDALNLWIEFSRRSAKFVVGECEAEWSRMTFTGTTIGSLMFMAKNDSPEEYRRWRETDLRTVLYSCLFEAKPASLDIAKVVKAMYHDRFVCVNSKKDQWYEYIQPKWVNVDDNIPLRLLLSTEVIDQFLKLKADIAKSQIGAGGDDVTAKRLEDQESKCRKIVTKLKEPSFQASVLRLCQFLFYDENFTKMMDENKMLWCFSNGVYDLDLGVFREGRPDDYITLCCGHEYRNFTMEDDDVKEVLEFFRKVFPNLNIREFFMDCTCATMEGGNVNKTFLIATGDGDNSKSVTFSFIFDAFGDYCINFPRALLTKGPAESSSGARPELNRVRGRRLAQVAEIAKDRTLDIGALKELTGNDRFFVRGLYEAGTEIKPMFTLFLQVNEVPKMPGHDDATYNRSCITPFESKFVTEANREKWPVPKTEEEQFKMKRFHADPRFSQRMKELIPAFLWLLTERYKDYRKRGLRKPKEVIDATNAHKKRNDIYMQFLSEFVERVPYDLDADEIATMKSVPKGVPFMTLTELYTEFRGWYSTNHTSYAKEESYSKLDVLHEISKKLGASVKFGARQVGWLGYRLIQEEVTEEDTNLVKKMIRTVDRPSA